MKRMMSASSVLLVVVSLLTLWTAVPATELPGVSQRLVPHEARPWGPLLWPSQPPADCPFTSSETIAGVVFTRRHAEYVNADTWYPSWASDGAMYSPWTDGMIEGETCISANGKDARTGQAKIEGDDPLKLKVTSLHSYPGPATPYGGRYPCGSLVYNGVWYYGTYCLDDEKVPGYNWGVLGPFVGFRYSKDLGQTWADTPHTPEHPLFGESGKDGAVVKIGSPHFVDFGRNMEHSPDGKAYLVAHGAVAPDPQPRPANNSWICGDQIYLLRVTPSPETINAPGAYEFFAGRDVQGQPVWTHDFSKIKPLVDWNNRCGCVTMTYNPGLKKYLMCVTDGWPTVKTMNTWIAEADAVTGPWKLVAFMKNFGTQAYFVNFPSKFISPDGRTAWLCYANNFTQDQAVNPAGGRYGMCLQEVRLPDAGGLNGYAEQTREQDRDLVKSSRNLALSARASASSVYPGYSAAGAIDGNVGGYPNITQEEWASQGEQDSALLRLTWATTQTVERVVLFDRPNTATDQVTRGLLYFNDGSTIQTGPLPDDAKQGLEVTFPPRPVKWLVFFVTGVKPSTPNAGLSEIAVFGPEKK